MACSAGFISPISSSISVPVSACSNLPMRVVAAPVNAPRSWPKSSLSSSSAGSAAQFTLTNGRLRRVERWWMARETSSLPTPLSPRMSTVTSLSETCSMTVRDAAHLLAVAPDRPILVVAELLAQLAQLRDEPVLLDRVLDRDVERDFAEPLGIVRLDDVVGGAEPHGLDDRRGLVAARQHDDLRFRSRGLERAQRGQAVEARHHHVEQDDIGRFGLLHRGEQFVAPRVASRFIPAQRKKRSEIGGKRRIIIDDRDVRAFSSSLPARVFGPDSNPAGG